MTDNDTREFYVEVAYAWPGAERALAWRGFPLALEHYGADGDVLALVDNANGGLVVAVPLQTPVETCGHGEPVSVAGDLLWACGEALGIANETMEDYLESRGILTPLPDAHRVNVVHTSGLLEAMRDADDGMESKRETFGDDGGEMVGS